MQYCYDSKGVLTPCIFPETPGFGILVPANGIELEKELKVKKGYVWVLQNGEPAQIKDNRGTYYSKETGKKVEFVELGDIPDTLTSLAPSSEYDEWIDESWVKNVEKEAKAKRNSIPPISKRQAMLQLDSIGLYDDLITFINQSENKTLKIEFEYSSSFERNSPVILGMALQFKLSDEQVDNLFIEASKL